MKRYRIIISGIGILVFISTCSGISVANNIPEASPAVRILETPSIAYSSLQAAYDAAQDGNTIQCRAVVLNEDLTFNRDIGITLSGGYNSDFSGQGSEPTIITGEATLSSGTMSAEDITVNPEIPSQAPAAPVLSTSQELDTKVYLDWSESANADGYKVKYGTQSSTYTQTEYIDSATEYIVRGLANNTAYYFVVSAYNEYGESADSNEMGAMPQPRAATAGYETVYASTSAADTLGAVSLAMPREGTIQSISMYHSGGSGQVILGIYADSGSAPAGLLGQSAATTLNAAAGWQEIDLASAVHVENGTAIWLAWVYSVNPGIRYISSGTAYTCAETYSSLGGTMPATFPSGSSESRTYSVYANYIINSEPSVDTFTPADKSSAAAGDGQVTITMVSSSDTHYDDLEYQYVIDDVVKQSWSASGSYSWTTQESDFGEHSFKIQIRDDIGAENESQTRNIFIYHSEKINE